MLADVLAREADDASASEVQRRELAAADHLAILHAQWEGETRPATVARYEAIVRDAVTEKYGDFDSSHRATWLWRTLRAAEAAGLDAGDVVRQAAGQGSLSDARDVAAVLDRRIRNITAGLVPQAPPSWSEQVPQLCDPDRQRYVTELAAAMDARRERIGEHLAGHPPAWAIRAFGEVPGHPSTAWTGRPGRRRSAPTGSCTPSSTPRRHSAPSHPPAPPNSGPSGTRRSKR